MKRRLLLRAAALLFFPVTVLRNHAQAYAEHLPTADSTAVDTTNEVAIGVDGNAQALVSHTDIDGSVDYQEIWQGIVIRGDSEEAIARLIVALDTTLPDGLSGVVGSSAIQHQVQAVADNAHVRGDVKVRLETTGITIELKTPFDLATLRNWGLPGQNPHFVGRDDALKQLATQLQQTNRGVIGQAISGLGGVGKTQLAIAFAYKHLAHDSPLHYDAVLWFQARQLPEQTLRLANLLGVDTQAHKGDELCKQLCRKLRPLGERILLVFDDAPNYATLVSWTGAIDALEQQHPFHLLATSRHDRWRDWQQLPLSVFTKAEAVTFIQQRLPETRASDAQQLASLLHHFPLALAQAVAYCHTNTLHPNEYIKRYTTSLNNQRTLLNTIDDMPRGGSLQTFFHNPQQRAVYTTWYLSIEALRETVPIAETVLNLCAFLASDGIPQWLMTDELNRHGLLSLDSLTWDNVLDHLRRYSLVTFHRATKTVEGKPQPPQLDIHQLVQTVIRLHLDQQHITDNDAASHLNGLPAIPTTAENQITTYQRYGHYALAKLAGLFGYDMTQLTSYQRYGHYVLAKLESLFTYDMTQRSSWHTAAMLYPHGRQIAELATNTTWDIPQTASLLRTLGNYQLEVVGDARTSKTHQEHALALFWAYYDKGHIEVAVTLNALANARFALGDYQDAKLMLEQALAIFEAHYGKNHVKIEVADTLTYLANVHLALGNITIAKTMGERALALKEVYYGKKDHVAVANTLTYLANVHFALGNITIAKTMGERALALKEVHYGEEDHVAVANTLTYLALTHYALGNITTAEKMGERALAIFEAHYGKNHVEVANTELSLAVAHSQLGQFAEAHRLLEHAYRCYADNPDYGVTHPNAQKIVEMRQELELLRSTTPKPPIQQPSTSLANDVAYYHQSTKFKAQPSQQQDAAAKNSASQSPTVSGYGQFFPPTTEDRPTHTDDQRHVPQAVLAF